jgi:hypothetical protein
MPKHFQLFTSAAERKGSNPRPCQARHRDGNLRRNACLAALRHEGRRCRRWQGLGILSRASRACPKMSDECSFSVSGPQEAKTEEWRPSGI